MTRIQLAAPRSSHEPAAAPLALAELDHEVESAMRSRPAWVGDRAADGDTGWSDQAAKLRALVGDVDGPSSASAIELPRDDQEPAVEPAMILTPLTISVASGKGGVGKTNIAVNLAAALASLGHRVTVLDADLGTANADVVCGVTVSARLEHVLTGTLGVHDGARRSLQDILLDVPGGFRLIPGSAGIARLTDLSAVDRRTLINGLNALEHETDVLIIDTAAGIGSGVTSFVDASDVCLVVSTPEPTSLADAYALIKCASSSTGEWTPQPRDQMAKFQLVMNQCVDGAEARRVGARLGAVCDRFLGLEVPMLGWIAQDMRVAEAVRARQLFSLRSPNCEAARNLSAIATSLAQHLEIPRQTVGRTSPRRGLAAALRRLFVS